MTESTTGEKENQPNTNRRRPSVTSTKIDFDSNRERKSSRRPKATMVSSTPIPQESPRPNITDVNKDGVPVVLAEGSKSDTKSGTDRGSSRRVKTSRPIMIESEKIYPNR